MATISRNLRRQLENGASSAFEALGYSAQAASDARRDTWWWLVARGRAARSGRGLLRSSAVAWTGLGYAELVPVDVPRPGPGEATIRVDVSAVSPGTERAHYLRLPNTTHVWFPGYSAAGTVVALGSEGGDLRIGDRVAAPGVGHASAATLPVDKLLPIPEGVRTDAAALVQLGVICGQGVDKAGFASGEAVGVVGSGSIGALALRLAVAAGAEPAAVIAATRSKEDVARRGGATRFLVTGDDDEEIGELGLPVVIEATGSPDGINVAIGAAGDGACVVLLGSPRGITRTLAIDQIRSKQLRLVGAHIKTLEIDPGRTAAEGQRLLAGRFLDALAAGMPVADLVGREIDPREAGIFYRELARDSGLVGAHFDWSRLSPRDRLSGRGFLRVPNLRGRGVDVHGPAIRAAWAEISSRCDVPDPLADAAGRLRIGMVGCGDIAVANAAAAVGAPNVELVACYDREQRLAEDLANQFGGAVCTGLEELLDRPDVDAVFLCVPHHLHSPLAIRAAEVGKHVIVEKPPANQFRDATAMIAAASEAGVVLSVCFPDRYEPGALLTRRLIELGALGEVEGFSVEFLRDKAPAYWLGGFSGRSQSDWRTVREKAGGGVLIMNLCHYLDLVRHLTVLDVEALSALTASTDATTEVEDGVSVTLRLGNGAVGTVVGGSAIRGAEGSEFRIWGRDGHVVLEPELRFFTLRTLGGVRTARWHSVAGVPKIATRAVYLSRLSTALARGAQPDVTVEDALAVQAVIEAAYEAARTATVVRPTDLLSPTIA